MRRGSLPSSSMPIALARRRAGSIVTTATRCPLRASPSASAAAVVVLPTPPGPAQTQTVRPASRRSSLTWRGGTGGWYGVALAHTGPEREHVGPRPPARDPLLTSLIY